MANDHQVVLAQDDSFLIEVWIWFAIGVLTIFLRMGVRLRTVGWRSLEGDDYLALFSLAMYTGDAFLVHICYHDGTNVDIPPGMVDRLTDEEVAKFKKGSQFQLAAWYTYTALIWTMKFMVLFFYRRLMVGTFQMKLIKYYFWMCAVTYIGVFLTITFGCHPFHDNWAVRPLPSRACTFKPQNFYVGAVLNVLTDAVLLSIPVPMLWGLQVNLKKKIAIGILLSSGLFVIAAAIIRAVLTLGSAPSGLNINRWGVRETIVGILTVNMPILPPMFKKAFWTGSGYQTSTSAGETTKTKGRYGLGTFELRSGTTMSRRDKKDGIETASQGSQDHIISKDGFGAGNVMIETSIDVQSHHKDEERSLEWSGEPSKSNYTTNVRMGQGPF